MLHKVKAGIKSLSTGENLVYLVSWFLLFAMPVLMMSFRVYTDSAATFDWHEVLVVWRFFAVLLVIFLFHNAVVAPLLLEKKRHWLYVGALFVLLSLFYVAQYLQRPHFEDRGPRHRLPRTEQRARRPGEPRMRSIPPRHVPMLFFGQHDLMATFVLFLLLGVNLGVKLLFKNERDAKTLELLERKNLEQQLEYLKYQINPHFFMNTLNNIHALIDIEPQMAQRSILELSRMMRYILYEGNKPLIPLSHEIAFLNNYITLMKLRYTEKVKITVDYPEKQTDALIPPLMLITFVENAFKHGVSYQRDSPIAIGIDVDDARLYFSCCNNKVTEHSKTEGGVGLSNVRQRLKLIYGDRYQLRIDDQGQVYDVHLSIPLKSEGVIANSHT